MKYIDCKALAQGILDEVKAAPDKLALVILRAGENVATQSYVKGKIKDCEYCGIECRVQEAKTPDELKKMITQANFDDTVGGIIVQLPLPEEFGDSKQYTDMVIAFKDVDGFTHNSHFKPCTPEGIMYIMEDWAKRKGWKLAGGDVVIVGRGELVGKPLAKMCLDADMTVTVMHSKTLVGPWKHHLDYADIVVSAVGKPGVVCLSNLKYAMLAIDVGISRDEAGKLCGDFSAFDCNASDLLEVTPVPGGVGLLTRAMLMRHVMEASKWYHDTVDKLAETVAKNQVDW